MVCCFRHGGDEQPLALKTRTVTRTTPVWSDGNDISDILVVGRKKGQGRRDASLRPKASVHRTPPPRIVRRMTRRVALPDHRCIDSLLRKNREILQWFDGDLLSAAGAADVDRFAGGVNFVRSAHRVKRLVHHRALPLSRDKRGVLGTDFKDAGPNLINARRHRTR